MPPRKLITDDLNLISGRLVATVGHAYPRLGGNDPDTRRRVEALAESILRNHRPARIYVGSNTPGWAQAVKTVAKRLRIRYTAVTNFDEYLEMLKRVDVILVLWDSVSNENIKQVLRWARYSGRPIVNAWSYYTGDYPQE